MNQLVLLINLIGLLLIDPLFLADISITQDLPTSMEAGSEVRVTVSVNKSDLSGFAKLQLDLPPGLTATVIETKGASFTFADQKAKFIWMALPSSPTFKVSYTLTADATVSGMKAIEGRLSYIEDNERKTFDLPTSTIEFTASTAPVAAEVPETPEVMESAIAVPSSTEIMETEPTASDLASTAAAAPVGSTMLAVVDQASGTPSVQGLGGVTGTRTITPVTEKEMLVEVIIKKGDIRGFGKLQETIPIGFTALEKTSSEAIFTAQDRVAKFVWLNLPSGDEVRVVYKLRAEDTPEGEYSINGEFGYLLNDETQKAVIGTSKFYIGPKAMQDLQSMDPDANKVDPMDVVDPDLALRERQAREAAEKEAREAEAKRLAEQREQEQEIASKAKEPVAQPKVTRIPAPENGVVYKVQITAGHREVGRTYFSQRHRYTGEFSLERHQGWVKYVTGRFGSYSEARDQRVSYVSAGHNFPGPFVTAYNNGERITVQEALMLSNQKWVQ